MKRKRNTIFYKIAAALALVLSFAACQKFADPDMVFEKEPENDGRKARKVLLVSIDGLAGLELAKYQPKNIAEMLAHSKYSFEAITDANTHDAASWTTMLSGKYSVNHGVTGNSFESGEDEGDDDNIDHEGSGESTGYLSVYQRLLESGLRLKTLSISPWAELDQYLFNLSDENGVVSSDEAAAKKAVDRIKNGDARLAFTVVNFRDLNAAGISGGFSMENTDYKAALDKIDGYLGDIVASIGARKESKNEDWLVIVTSNHGGVENSYGGASLAERKVPLIFYNPNFQKTAFSAPSLVNSMRMNSKGKQNGEYRLPYMSAENSIDYDIKADKEYTILFKVFNYGLPGGSSHAVVFGRTSHAYSGIKGWHFMIEGSNSGNRYRSMLGYGSGTSVQAIPNPATAAKEVWETIAMKLYFEGDKRLAVTYVNGVASDPVDMTGRNLSNAGSNFWLGSGDISSIGTFNGKINNITFVDKALSDKEIADFGCLETIDETVPYWTNVKGYWPLNEGSGNKLNNKAQNAPTNTFFTFTLSYAPWDLASSWSCTDPATAGNSKLLFIVDILPQVYYWLNVKTDDSWSLAGDVFLDQYEEEFVGK